MFTGIVEEIGEVIDVIKEDQNAHFVIKSVISSELKIDQSISHNGVCLTVVEQQEDWHKVTAISETLGITNLNSLKKGDLVNLERCLKVGDRLDGHMVDKVKLAISKHAIVDFDVVSNPYITFINNTLT